MTWLRRMRLGGHVTCMGKKRNAYGDFVEKSERKKPVTG
jgi:hypothetical protein